MGDATEHTEEMEHNAEIIGKQRACNHSGALQVYPEEMEVVCKDCGYTWC